MKRSTGDEEKTKCLQEAVLNWFADYGREFPWRGTHDPFSILVAEVLLRQTQAERVVEPYQELVSKFPDPASMGHANADQLRQWFHPLGLVRRADHMVEISRILVRDFGSRVPDSLVELMGLPGLGEYSARAVLCLAYDGQVPMIDEGSGRVLRRIFGLHSNRPAYSDRKLLAKAEKLLPSGFARSFNLGLIDIAAAYCHSKNPGCSPCILINLCCYGQHSKPTCHGEVGNGTIR